MARSMAATRTFITSSRRRGWLRLGFVGIICLIGVGYVSPAYSFFTRATEIEGAREVNGDLQATHDKLATEKERLMEGEYVEEVARRDLGLVKPGEQPFIVKDIQQENERSAALEEVQPEAKPEPDTMVLPLELPFRP